MKISYEIKYNRFNKEWVVWKNVEGERSINCYPIFKGNRKECSQKLKELKNEFRSI